MNLTDTHILILDSKDKLRFHLVRRVETGIDFYMSNLVLSIIARCPGFR
jgi:hypothetical protein